MKRLSRAEQNERNRGLVLDAARRIFLARGYHAATLDEIADEAGFSRGVVQSRFGNKADLFLALLEERIAERAAQNARLAEGLRGAEGVRVLREHAARRNRAELDWGLLLIEFRVHAARDPELSPAVRGGARPYPAGPGRGHHRGVPARGPAAAVPAGSDGADDPHRRGRHPPGAGGRSRGPAVPAAFERLRGFIESPSPSGDGARKARRPT